MSWFDASGLANIAKSALKGAQRTIDKALDIQEENLNQVPVNSPIDPNSEDFFGNWGLTQSANVPSRKDSIEQKGAKLQTSIWGSFTGSFFDNTKEEVKSNSFESLDDSTDTGSENFSKSKLVVQNSDDGDSQFSRLSSSDADEETLVEGDVDQTDGNLVEIQLDTDSINTTPIIKNEKLISQPQSKNSSESVELITCSTECTTSPESEIITPGVSASTSSSALGHKQTSESVEVLPNSCSSPSPSSVEVLGFSEIQDEFASPLQSPIVEEVDEKSSPDSVEVIQEEQEESTAEDTMSYTSISESTSTTVLDSNLNLHLKPQKLKDTYNRPNDIEEISPETITQVPKRCSMHLALRDVNQVLIDTQPQSIKQDITNILGNTNIIDIPPDNNDGNITKSSSDQNMDDTKSDKTLIASDGFIESSSDTESNNSSYLKNLLADAMTEKSVPITECVQPIKEPEPHPIEPPPRPNSPHSSESRSDLVKIGSISSGHTSGDDLETTTSSDIEIISSPGNGDSSSTQSRQSPLKQTFPKVKDDGKELLYKTTIKKAKGHNRELSEASSISDDSHSSEIERLLKRMAEMTEILESRESKLIDINRKNAELQELNIDLKNQLDNILIKQLSSVDVSQVTEEYTQRLSSLEKKFQQTIREKDNLRKQLDVAKQEAAIRMSKAEFDTILTEKDEIIKELREEGEKLSKQQLQHSNIIKKLRAKEKENETTIKNLKDNLETLTLDNERLKRSLIAKEDVERSQIDAIHQLTNKNKKIESEMEKYKSQLDDLTEKYDTVKKSLDAAKKELIDKNKTSSELMAREQLLETIENEKKMALDQNNEIMNQLEDLRSKLRQSEQEYVKKENILRMENNELLRRLENVEARNQELSQSILEVSKPLVRQLEQLQAAHSFKITTYEKMEQELNLKIGDLQSRLQCSTNSERLLKEECVGLRAKVSDLEAQLSTMKHKNEMLDMKFDQFKTEKQIEMQELKRKFDEVQEELKLEKDKVINLQKEAKALQQQLNAEKSSYEMETKRMSQDFVQLGRTTPQTGSNSPTLSLGKASIPESMNSSFWSQDEPFDITTGPRYTNMLEMQMLQTSLKQRDGEVQQLQWELNRREQERSLLNTEISSLLTKVEELDNELKILIPIKTQFDELQQKYDTLCELYGEKVEENEELKLDLQDVKDMYKSQIDELLNQQKQS